MFKKHALWIGLPILVLVLLGIVAVNILNGKASDGIYAENSAPKGEARQLYEKSINSDNFVKDNGIVIDEKKDDRWLHLKIKDGRGHIRDLYAYEDFGWDGSKPFKAGDKVLFTYNGNYLRTIERISRIPNDDTSRRKSQSIKKFISEDKALDIAGKLPDILKLKQSKARIVLTISESPSATDTRYIIRVAKDKGDHYATYDFITINAVTGKVVAREFQY